MKARLLTPELEITGKDKVYSTNALSLPHTQMLIKLAASANPQLSTHAN